MVQLPATSKHSERILACSIRLSSDSQLLGNLEWSELGQALVVTDEALVVLSPLIGLHPSLASQSRAQDVECHPEWEGRFPHSIIHINIKTFLENDKTVRRRSLLEADHSAVDPRYLGIQWSSASWSKPGLGPHGSCLILATTSELDLFILGAPRNAWTGEWQVLHVVDLSPVADLTVIDAPSESGDDSDGRDAFSQSRALVRKKQLAAEVVCAAFVDASESPAAQPTSMYIIAGTNSGHIAVWECQAKTGHCTFVTASAVSKTGIQNLLTTTHPAARTTDAHAQIAFQDAKGIRLCEFFVQQDRSFLQLSPHPPVASHHGFVSAWRWIDQHLIFATIGRVGVYDVSTGSTAVFSLETEPDSSLDPYSPVIRISRSSGPQQGIDVTLQNLREYHIPSTSVSQAEHPPQAMSLAPSHPPLCPAILR